MYRFVQEKNMTPSTSMAPSNMVYGYVLKMINPSRMSEYKNVEIQRRGYCKSFSELKEFISSNLPSTIEAPNLQEVEMGFIEPGHGGKGRKVWLLMIMMYRKCMKFIYTKSKFFCGAILMFLLTRSHQKMSPNSVAVLTMAHN